MKIEPSAAPWRVVKGRVRIEANIWSADGRCVAQMVRDEDAPIVAIAPELLATVKDLLDLHIAHHNHPHHARARALIAQTQE